MERDALWLAGMIFAAERGEKVGRCSTPGYRNRLVIIARFTRAEALGAASPREFEITRDSEVARANSIHPTAIQQALHQRP